MDQTSLFAQDFINNALPYVIDALTFINETDSNHHLTLQWGKRLASWNGNSSLDSVEALLFNSWFIQLSRQTSKEVGSEYWTNPYYLIASISNKTYPDPACQSHPSCAEKAAQLFASVVDSLGLKPINNTSGCKSVTWGSSHFATFEHVIFGETPLGCLFDRSVPFGGDKFTVNIGNYDEKTLTVNDAASYRHVIDLSDLENSVFISASGQSGNIMSPHYDDWLEKWAEGDYLPMKTKSYTTAEQFQLNPSK